MVCPEKAGLSIDNVVWETKINSLMVFSSSENRILFDIITYSLKQRELSTKTAHAAAILKSRATY